MRRKRIVCFVLLLVMISTAVPGWAFDSDKHDTILEWIFFGRQIIGNRNVDYASQRLPDEQALLALEYASYLAVDQYNSKGEDKFNFLKSFYHVPDMPEKYSDIDFGSSWHHRSYTHRGWNHEYIIDKAKWPIRKKSFLQRLKKFLISVFFQERYLGTTLIIVTDARVLQC